MEAALLVVLALVLLMFPVCGALAWLAAKALRLLF
jgi:hypothetical protein